jgi:hypothetical protein
MRFCARHSGSVRCLACDLRRRRVGAQRTEDDPSGRRSGRGVDDGRDGAPERQVASASPLAAARSLPSARFSSWRTRAAVTPRRPAISRRLWVSPARPKRPRTTIRSLSPVSRSRSSLTGTSAARASRLPAIAAPSGGRRLGAGGLAGRSRGCPCWGPRALSHGRYSSSWVTRRSSAPPARHLGRRSHRSPHHQKPPVSEIKRRRLVEAEGRPWEAAGSVASRRRPGTSCLGDPRPGWVSAPRRGRRPARP